jgi:hypothetical protein
LNALLNIDNSRIRAQPPATRPQGQQQNAPAILRQGRPYIGVQVKIHIQPYRPARINLPPLVLAAKEIVLAAQFIRIAPQKNPPFVEKAKF